MSAKQKPKARLGRPPLPPGTQKAIRLSVRVTPAEATKLQSEAKRLGITVSQLLMRPWRKGQKGDT